MDARAGERLDLDRHLLDQFVRTVTEAVTLAVSKGVDGASVAEQKRTVFAGRGLAHVDTDSGSATR
eukprot:6341603-Prymnesium_polylepis.1